MNQQAHSEIYYENPVKGQSYQQSLAAMNAVSNDQCTHFLAQWYAFSSFIPKFLSLCAWKADSEIERSNILTNLFSELGAGTASNSHPVLLADLILKATGKEPEQNNVTLATRKFLANLELRILNSKSSFNSGSLQALEHVAYDILGVLKEILEKSGKHELASHPYITIHEQIELEHIQCTNESVRLHLNERTEVDAGFEFVMSEWLKFWNALYDSFRVPTQEST